MSEVIKERHIFAKKKRFCKLFSLNEIKKSITWQMNWHLKILANYLFTFVNIFVYPAVCRSYIELRFKNL